MFFKKNKYSSRAESIILSLLDAGFSSYYVGGCVRDLLRGKISSDIDIATNACLNEIKRIFPKAAIIGEAFSVALVHRIEVATFRQDGPYSDFRHPDFVKIVPTIEEDLSRRDFTINAIAMDIEGKLVDPYSGKTDLENKIVRFVGEPDKRLSEDPIRALRACRFAALIGGKIEENSKEVILQNHFLLRKVAKERIQLELNKILMLDNREAALILLSSLHLLEEILPELAKSINVPQKGYHAEDCWTHAVKATQAVIKKDLNLRLAALLHDVAKPTQRIRDEDGIDHFYGHEIKGVKMVEKELRYLKYSLHTIGYVKEATRYHMTRIMFVHEMKDATIRRLMGRLKYISIRDLLRLQIADMRGNLREPYSLDEQIKLLRYVLKRIRKIEKEDHALKITDLAINGDDIIKIFKIKPGRKVGKALHYCLEEVLKDPELNKKESLISLLEKERQLK
ncbi:MAG: polynucleotide adenylyltransferase [Chlamydiae bacterium]|nr:MAG: polynucleotide adenylyltransferase [Chlamydiota bacterium]